jgi:hypothetical protein
MSRAELLKRMKALAKEMQTVGAAMDYFGGLEAEFTKHGRELFGAGRVVKSWVKEIEVNKE